MKFGQLKQYSREILLWRSHTKCGEETSSRPFSKKNQNWAFISIRNLKIYTVFFYLCPVRELSKYIETGMQMNYLCLIWSFYKKQKERLVSLPHFLHDFLNKNVSQVLFYQLVKFHGLITFTSWDFGKHVYCNCLFPRLWGKKLWD